MTQARPMADKPHNEWLTAAKFGAVGCIGFLTDITVLRLGLIGGLSPFAARMISLTCAMQVTFLINGLVVFRCLKRHTALRQWLTYMSTNGVGNLCNYLIFAGLILTHWPFISKHGPALWCGSFCAYFINYAGARWLCFGKPQSRGADVCKPLGAKPA
jgi:putative flippase GtrA